MDNLLLVSHNVLRWAVILFGLYAITKAVRGVLFKQASIKVVNHLERSKAQLTGFKDNVVLMRVFIILNLCDVWRESHLVTVFIFYVVKRTKPEEL